MHPLTADAPFVPPGSPAATATASPDVRQPDSAHDHDILTAAEGSPRLGMFVDFMRAAGLAPLLLDGRVFTVFAPTDRAFCKLSLRERDALLADHSRLNRVMRGHVLLGRCQLPAPGQSGAAASTIDGERRLLTAMGGARLVEHARIVQANIRASNGVIHAIDSLLI